MTPLTPSRFFLALVRRLHFLALLAMMVPLFCQIVTSGMNDREAAIAYSHFLPLYLLTLSLAIPAAFLYLIQEKAKNLGTCLLCACPVGILFLAGLFFLERSAGLSVQGAEQPPQALILLLYLLDAIRMRTNDNSRRRARAQQDISWRGDVYLLPLPALPILIPFVMIYVGALFLHSDALAQCALIGAILYFFLVLPFHVLIRKEEFLKSRHHLSRIPARQIGRLQLAALAQVLVPCAVLAAAAVMTSGGRFFLNLPALRLKLPTDYTKAGYEQDALLRELMEAGLLEKGAPPPQWLLSLISFVENALAVLLTVFLLYLLWLGVRNLCRRFRRFDKEEAAASASGDLPDEHVRLKPALSRVEIPREARGIRRRYRRTILHYRGEAPEPYETPAVMEQRACLPDTPQMRALHDDYERARYRQHAD